jgi:hypothetical protein
LADYQVAPKTQQRPDMAGLVAMVDAPAFCAGIVRPATWATTILADQELIVLFLS